MQRLKIPFNRFFMLMLNLTLFLRLNQFTQRAFTERLNWKSTLKPSELCRFIVPKRHQFYREILRL